MASYVTNLVINAGSDFVQSFFLESPISNSAIDLTGYSAISQIKKSPASLKKTADFNVTFPNRQVGQIKISLASSITSNLKPGRYSYDVLIIAPDSITSRAIEGRIIVTAGVTTS